MVSRNTIKPRGDNNSAIQFCGEVTSPAGAIIPEILLYIQRVWKYKADKYGDGGFLIVCAAFLFTYEGQEYIMPPTSSHKHNLSWEHCIEEITIMLEVAGATNIYFDRGLFEYSQP